MAAGAAQLSAQTLGSTRSEMPAHIAMAILIAQLDRARAPREEPQCLPYEPHVVALDGSIERKTFPGRPNYEDVNAGDEPETYWLINLASPVCVAGPPDELDMPEHGIVQVQLILKQEQYAAFKHLVGQRVRASGTLMHSITGHHKTPVLLWVQSLAATK